MKKFFPLTILAVVVLLASCANDSNNTAPLDIRILHMNDTHSHFESIQQDLTFDEIGTVRAQIGGMAEISTILNELRSERENVLTLHAGDAIMGTTYFTFFNGNAEADVLNAMGFEALSIGNHEFDLGDEFLAELIQKFDFPVISANVVPDKGNVLDGLFSPYIIKEFDGQKIGIIGLTIAQKTKESSSPSDEIQFHEEAKTVQKYVDVLKKKKIKKIIVLAHDTYEKVSAWAPLVTDVDVIVSGDSHTKLGELDSYGLVSEGSYPTVTTSKNGDPVYIVQAWEYGKMLGALDVTFEGDIVTSASGHPYIPVSAELKVDSGNNDDKGNPQFVEVNGDELAKLQETVEASGIFTIVSPDPSIEGIIKGYNDMKGEAEMEVIASVSENLGHNRIPGDGRDGYVLPLGSDIAPIVAKAFYEIDPKADLSIQNGGGVRISIPAGDLTMKEAYELLPFSNTMYEINMTGAEIVQVMEDALSNALDNGSTGSFPYAYGIRYDVDATKDAYSRINNMEILDRKTGVWSPIEMDSFYVVLTNDYIASGKDGYVTFKTVQDERGNGYDTMTDYALSFIKYARELESAGNDLSKLSKEEFPMKSYIPNK